MPTKPKVHNPLSPALQARLAQQREADRERRRKAYEAQPQRTADRAFYCSAPWRKFRDYLLAKPEFALCVECKAEGRLTPTHTIDHIIDRKAAPELAFVESNMQPLCNAHHRAKTNRKT